jgi:hypothetical protein
MCGVNDSLLSGLATRRAQQRCAGLCALLLPAFSSMAQTEFAFMESAVHTIFRWFGVSGTNALADNSESCH